MPPGAWTTSWRLHLLTSGRFPVHSRRTSTGGFVSHVLSLSYNWTAVESPHRVLTARLGSAALGPSASLPTVALLLRVPVVVVPLVSADRGLVQPGEGGARVSPAASQLPAMPVRPSSTMVITRLMRSPGVRPGASPSLTCGRTAEERASQSVPLRGLLLGTLPVDRPNRRVGWPSALHALPWAAFLCRSRRVCTSSRARIERRRCLGRSRPSGRLAGSHGRRSHHNSCHMPSVNAPDPSVG